MSGLKLVTFNAALWAFAVVACLWLLGWPLVKNAWASSHWKQLECRLDRTNHDKYLYVVDEKVYVSSRRDFWDMGSRSDRGVSSSIRDPDGVCWVDPNDAFEAVHYLDAPSHWAGAGNRIVSSGLLLVVAASLTWGDRLRKRRTGAKG